MTFRTSSAVGMLILFVCAVAVLLINPESRDVENMSTRMSLISQGLDEIQAINDQWDSKLNEDDRELLERVEGLSEEHFSSKTYSLQEMKEFEKLADRAERLVEGLSRIHVRAPAPQADSDAKLSQTPSGPSPDETPSVPSAPSGGFVIADDEGC